MEQRELCLAERFVHKGVALPAVGALVRAVVQLHRAQNLHRLPVAQHKVDVLLGDPVKIFLPVPPDVAAHPQHLPHRGLGTDDDILPHQRVQHVVEGLFGGAEKIFLPLIRGAAPGVCAAQQLPDCRRKQQSGCRREGDIKPVFQKAFLLSFLRSFGSCCLNMRGALPLCAPQVGASGPHSPHGWAYPAHTRGSFRFTTKGTKGVPGLRPWTPKGDRLVFHVVPLPLRCPHPLERVCD